MPKLSTVECSRADDAKESVRELLTRPCTVSLPSTKTLAGMPVLWMPGYKVGSHYFGPQPADIMFIGKCLTDDDVREDRPFSEYVGDFMRGACEYYGLEYEGIYVTNLMKFAMPYRGVNVPSPWLNCGIHTLHQEIAIVQPKFILCLGADVVKAVAQSKQAKLKNFRGEVHDIAGAKVMATNSPADVLRNPEKQGEFSSGFRAFSDVVKGGSIEEEVDYRYLKTLEEFEQAVKEMMPENRFALDCEWEGDSHVSGRLMSVQVSPKPKVSFVFCFYLPVEGFELKNQSRGVELLRQLLQRPHVQACGHNFRADMKWLRCIGLDLTHQFVNNGFDTMLASHLLMETNEHGLTACLLRDTDMNKYDAAVEQHLDRKIHHSEMPLSVLLPYAAADTDATFRLWEKYEARLWSDHIKRCAEMGVEDQVGAVMSPRRARAKGVPWVNSLWNLYRFVVLPVNSVINEMEEEGLLIDTDRLIAMIDLFNRKKLEMLQEIRHVVCDPQFNPNSVNQKRILLFGDPNYVDDTGRKPLCLGLRPVKSSGKRSKMWDELEHRGLVWYEEGVGWKSNQYNPSCDSETLGILAEAGSFEAEMLRDYSYIDQICKNFLRDEEENPETGIIDYQKGLVGLMHEDKRVRTSISQMTETGRWRSARPNCQNFPKAREADLHRIFHGFKVPKIRSGIIAAPGHVLIEADFSSAEIWTLAYISDDPVMKEDLRKVDASGSPISLHSTVALEVFKIKETVEEFERIRSEGGPLGEKYELYRIAAKSINFGIPYQRSGTAIARLCQRLGVPCQEEDGNGWVASWYDRYKEAAKYIEFCKNSVFDPQHIRMPFGRLRHFIPSVYEDVCAAMQREACNAPIQGTVADALSYALVLLQRARDDFQLKSKILLAIHDAVLMMVPYEEIPKVCESLHWALSDSVEVPGTGLHYDIDIEMGMRWGEKLPKPVVAALKDGLWETVSDQLVL